MYVDAKSIERNDEAGEPFLQPAYVQRPSGVAVAARLHKAKS
jgi:hypothetical protein